MKGTSWYARTLVKGRLFKQSLVRGLTKPRTEPISIWHTQIGKSHLPLLRRNMAQNTTTFISYK